MAKFSIVLTAFAGVALAASALPAQAATADSPAGQAKISVAQARQIALTAQSGQIIGGELETEAGGSGLRYSFDIAADANGTTHEVGVDANTGAVLENSIDTPLPDQPAAPVNKRAPRSM